MNKPKDRPLVDKSDNLSPTRQSLRAGSVYFDKLQDELRIIEECKQSLDELIKASKWLNSQHQNNQQQTLFGSKKHTDIPKNYTKLVSFNIENTKNQSDRDYYDNTSMNNSLYSLNSNDYLFKDDDIIEFNNNSSNNGDTSTNNINTFKSSFELKLKSKFEDSNNNNNNNNNTSNNNKNNNKNKNDTKIGEKYKFSMKNYLLVLLKILLVNNLVYFARD
jgi:hypothetical protein